MKKFFIFQFKCRWACFLILVVLTCLSICFAIFLGNSRKTEEKPRYEIMTKVSRDVIDFSDSAKTYELFKQGYYFGGAPRSGPRGRWFREHEFDGELEISFSGKTRDGEIVPLLLKNLRLRFPTQQNGREVIFSHKIDLASSIATSRLGMTNDLLWGLGAYGCESKTNIGSRRFVFPMTKRDFLPPLDQEENRRIYGKFSDDLFAIPIGKKVEVFAEFSNLHGELFDHPAKSIFLEVEIPSDLLKGEKYCLEVILDLDLMVSEDRKTNYNLQVNFLDLSWIYPSCRISVQTKKDDLAIKHDSSRWLDFEGNYSSWTSCQDGSFFKVFGQPMWGRNFVPFVAQGRVGVPLVVKKENAVIFSPDEFVSTWISLDKNEIIKKLEEQISTPLVVAEPIAFNATQEKAGGEYAFAEKHSFENKDIQELRSLLEMVKNNDLKQIKIELLQDANDEFPVFWKTFDAIERDIFNCEFNFKPGTWYVRFFLPAVSVRTKNVSGMTVADPVKWGTGIFVGKIVIPTEGQRREEEDTALKDQPIEKSSFPFPGFTVAFKDNEQKWKEAIYIFRKTNILIESASETEFEKFEQELSETFNKLEAIRASANSPENLFLNFLRSRRDCIVLEKQQDYNNASVEFWEKNYRLGPLAYRVDHPLLLLEQKALFSQFSLHSLGESLTQECGIGIPINSMNWETMVKFILPKYVFPPGEKQIVCLPKVEILSKIAEIYEEEEAWDQAWRVWCEAAYSLKPSWVGSREEDNWLGKNAMPIWLKVAKNAQKAERWSVAYTALMKVAIFGTEIQADEAIKNLILLRDVLPEKIEFDTEKEHLVSLSLDATKKLVELYESIKCHPRAWMVVKQCREPWDEKQEELRRSQESWRKLIESNTQKWGAKACIVFDHLAFPHIEDQHVQIPLAFSAFWVKSR